MMYRIAAGALALATVAATPAAAQEIVRKVASPTAAIAESVLVPAGAATLYVSGLTPEALPGTAPTDVNRFGDTETQTRSILKKINAALMAQGFGPQDVVMMRIVLVAPAGMPKMDFMGMMKAYKEFYGTAEQPNKPARITTQIAALGAPGALVEIEVQAAKVMPKMK